MNFAIKTKHQLMQKIWCSFSLDVCANCSGRAKNAKHRLSRANNKVAHHSSLACWLLVIIVAAPLLLLLCANLSRAQLNKGDMMMHSLSAKKSLLLRLLAAAAAELASLATVASYCS